MAHAEDMPARGPERLFVKWRTPEEELVSTAKLAFALIDRRIAKPRAVAIAAPNRNWAAQMLAAAETVAAQLPGAEAAATLCVPALRASTAVRDALAALDAAAAGEGGAEALAHLRGRSLARRAGLADLPEAAHALRHLEGDEDAPALAALVRAQLAAPTPPTADPAVSIVLAGQVPDGVDYLFAIGCVNGLVPGAAAFEAPDPADRAAALAAGRAAFAATVAAARVRTTISCFTRMPVDVARAAHVRFARCKTEQGAQLAMTEPTVFLTEAGSVRPTTEGGQALLRKYRLN